MMQRFFRSISSLVMSAVIAALVLYGAKDLGTILANGLANYGPLGSSGSSISQTIRSLLPPSPPHSVNSSTTSANNTTAAETNSVTSNWAGYAAGGGLYSGITGSWTTPSIANDSARESADATWIGIGGMSSSDLIQVGTEDVIVNGRVQRQAFYEELPAYSVTIPDITVSAGDVIKASLQETGNGEWTISLTNATNGDSYTNVVSYHSSLSSAEWIQEAPSSPQGIMALDDFSPLNFTDATTTKNSQPLPLAGVNPEAITMVNNRHAALTNVSTLDGTGFTVSRTDVPSTGAQIGSSSSWQRREPGYGRYRY